MAHEVETMMYAGDEPWHGLGTKVDEHISIDDAIIAAGLDWEVKSHPLYWKTSYNPDDLYLADDNYVQVRMSDKKILGLTKAGYTPLQNREAFGFFQEFLDEGECTLHTAGSLKGGKVVWVLAKINGARVDVGDDDKVDAYALLSNSHDGSLAVRAGFTPIRIVCANTMDFALSAESGSKLVSIKHTKNMHSSLDLLRSSMDMARQEFLATADTYIRLAESDCSTEDVRKMVQVVMGINDTQVIKGNSTLSQIITNFHTGRGAELDTAKGTWWGAYNALTEYTSHHYGNSADSRLHSNWFGANKSKNAKALSYCMEQIA